MFEKVVCNRIYNFLLNERLLNPNQFGVRPSDSCINYLLAFTHKIFESFVCNPSLEVKSVFLDIFKANYKFKSMGISGEFYVLIENYLSGRLQIVILNEKTSSWRPILVRVPLYPILGPLLFLIYINDLPNGLKTNAKLFADDTSLFTIIHDKNESSNALSNDISSISK